MRGLIFGLVLAVPVTVLVYLVFAPVARRARRKKLRAGPPPADLEGVLTRNVRLYSIMPAELREQLLGHASVFLAEKEFIGRGGQEITDEIRYIVAGTACILLLNREPRYFPGFTSILVYPDTYQGSRVRYDGLVEVHEKTAR